MLIDLVLDLFYCAIQYIKFRKSHSHVYRIEIHEAEIADNQKKKIFRQSMKLIIKHLVIEANCLRIEFD